ncbi:MAG TPA: anti-sigma factor [Bacteroidota bacterium]|nr:anti-sigma factor [Bacteroidota bacterium]
MNRHVREMMFEYLSGEVAGAEAAKIDEHLARCASCREDLRILREALEILPQRGNAPSEERDGQFWASFPARVEERIRQERRPGVPFLRDAADRVVSFMHFNGAPLLAGSGALAAIALACVLLLRPGSGPGPAGPVQTAAEALPVQLQPAGAALDDYLKKSRVLLVGVANLRTDGDRPIDLSFERRQSRVLVHEARGLKKQRLDPRSARLVGDLEKILIALANSDEKHDGPDVEIIRSGIRHNNLLFKIRMTESALATAGYERTAR